MINALSNEALEQALTTLNSKVDSDKHWQLKEGKLYRLFKFDDFSSAFSWMTKMAIWAEKQDHHPEWFNVYNRVEVYLTTHDAGGISERDFKLAEVMNKG
ncbi:4a-hydroxytetrahydrobiopterin dehydratase [Alteromonas sediminis]|uniref:Putative pterin-4-alpha-carbinolamine dehydratase n=1 Tax=Alteromonas sediminis TaxID=2259342 RepID=A0A3N5ZBG7_9ALTE|nr:4a-hydroxytetrahydrobiopterin dehydratase [Alteromonas sediminis]RPJ68654.1 4a-hydroxytetrahydrobiopterin dehydratase [Alteromonas sediminis]